MSGDNELGARLRQARLDANLSQSALSSIVGVTGQAISNIERGVTECPSVKNLTAIAKTLNVDPNWLITGKGSPDVQAKEDAAKCTVKPMPWPQSPNQINLAMVNDIADRVCAATGADIHMIKKEIFAGIIDHYKKKEENNE